MKKILLGIVLVIIGGGLFIKESYTLFSEFNSNDISIKKVVLYDNFNSIKIENFVGDIELIKGDRNEIAFSDNVKLYDDYNSHSLVLKSKVNKTNNLVHIIYRDNINIKIEDSVGSILGVLSENSMMIVSDFVGKVNLEVPSNVNVEIEDLLGTIENENIIIDYNSNTRFFTEDFVGKIKLKNNNK